jgi:hypothetical protein
MSNSADPSVDATTVERAATEKRYKSTSLEVEMQAVSKNGSEIGVASASVSLGSKRSGASEVTSTLSS